MSKHAANVSVQIEKHSVIVPEDWPDYIFCPSCGIFHATTEFIFLQREHEYKGILHRIIKCPITKHCLAPTPEYLRLYDIMIMKEVG